MKQKELHYNKIKVNDTLSDIINHPAFIGFGQFLIPKETMYSKNNTLKNSMQRLFPYHSHTNVVEAVNILNHMIDEVQQGNSIFYDYYTQEQKKEDMDKKSTGLFYFKGIPGAPFALICPGGGFHYVGSLHEGFPHAIALSQKGYNVFVIQYRVGGWKSQLHATEDLANAIGFIFDNAKILEVDTNNYSLWGSSAGARMVANIASYGTVGFSKYDLPNPVSVIMAYTGHSSFSKVDPPTFMVIGEDDSIVYVPDFEKRVRNMRNAGIDVEYIKFKNVGHGFGVGKNTQAEGWIDKATVFWQRYIS